MRKSVAVSLRRRLMPFWGQTVYHVVAQLEKTVQTEPFFIGVVWQTQNINARSHLSGAEC